MNTWIIVVKQRGVMTPRLYKCRQEKKPTVRELQILGADIHIPRKDKVTVQKALPEVFAAWPGAWLRPYTRP